MAQTIQNRATLTYNYGTVTGATATSNTATTVLQGPLSVTKTSLGTGYTAGEEKTFIISLNNAGGIALNNVTVTDDLGTYTLTDPALDVTPLTFVAPAALYINGVNATDTLTVTSTDPSSLVFTIPTLPAGANAQITYNAQINNFADLSATGGTISNTATANATDLCELAESTATLAVNQAANIQAIKDMSPNPVNCGDRITYTMTFYNYGNIPASTVQMTDTFNPIPTDIAVTYDGVATTDYTYDETTGLLTVPTTPTADNTIPAAIYTRNADGTVNVEPGTLTVTVTGTVS